MDAQWIVSANAGRARFFSQAQAGAPLEEIEDMVNAAARLRTADTESDDLGRRTSSVGRSSAGTPSQASGYEPHQTPAEHQTQVFARSVAEFLQRGHQQHRYRKLSLIASPEFLGVLRKALDPGVGELVTVQIDKDYTQSTRDQLREQIRKHAEKG